MRYTDITMGPETETERKHRWDPVQVCSDNKSVDSHDRHGLDQGMLIFLGADETLQRVGHPQGHANILIQQWKRFPAALQLWNKPFQFHALYLYEKAYL